MGEPIDLLGILVWFGVCGYCGFRSMFFAFGPRVSGCRSWVHGGLDAIVTVSLKSWLVTASIFCCW